VNYFQLLIPDFLLILSGYILCHYTALNERIWVPIENLVYFCLFPALLFNSIVKSKIVLSSLLFMGCGVIITLFAVSLALALPKIPYFHKFIDRHAHAGAAQTAYRFNSFIALSLSERLAGAQGLFLMSMLIAVCVPIVNVFAVWPMAQQSDRNFLKELRKNPLIITTCLALAFNVMGFSVPSAIEPTLSRVGSSSIVLGLMAAGAGLRLKQLWQDKTLSVSVLGIRHVLNPLICSVLLQFVFLSPTEAQILITFAALPTASSCYVLASRMGYNAAHVAGLVTVSLILGMFSLPLALQLIN
jgi:malonate transporter and related proteins